MIKYLLSIAILVSVFSTEVKAQKKYPFPKDVSEKMMASIPVSEGKIFFEEEIQADPSLKKDELFTRLQKWFADSFVEDKTTIEADDKQNGLLAAKATFKYKKIAGLIVHTGYINCAIKLAVQDGRIKYQLADFSTNESTNGLTGLASTGIKRSYDLSQALEEYKNDKNANTAARQLDNMNQFVYYVQMSLRDLSK